MKAIVLFLTILPFIAIAQNSPTAASTKTNNPKLVESVKGGSIYEKLGLQKNDVIKSVNGKPVKGANELYEITGRMQTAEPITIEVLRNGKTEVIKLNSPAAGQTQ